MVGAGALLGRSAVARAARTGLAAGGTAGTGGLFARPLGRLVAGEVRTIAVRKPVSLAAVRWSSPADARLMLRARRLDGRWGPWGTAASAGHDGDGVQARGHVGEGLWLGRTTELQVRSRNAAHDVSVQFVPAEAGTVTPALARVSVADRAPLAAGLPLAGPALPAGPGQPPIIARAAWAGNDHRPVGGPEYGAIEMGIVHHTENPNGYAPGEVPAMLRAIYEFHVHGRGWFDIGYNFVVDRFGRIWEARQGGIDLPVVGAQAGDWNGISFGVSLLGTYTAVPPSRQALDALERLLAWKLALSGLPAIGEISAVASPSDISYTQFRPGEHVRFPRIAGHRQVDSTDCPGNALFAELPAVRRRVQSLIGPEARIHLDGEITLFADGPVVFLSGALTEAGAPVAGAQVQLQRIVGRAGRTQVLSTLTTAADGRFQASLPARAGLLVRVARTTAPAAASGLLGVESLGAALANGADALRSPGAQRSRKPRLRLTRRPRL